MKYFDTDATSCLLVGIVIHATNFTQSSSFQVLLILFNLIGHLKIKQK